MIITFSLTNPMYLHYYTTANYCVKVNNITAKVEVIRSYNKINYLNLT